MTSYHEQKYDGNLITSVAPEALLIPASTLISVAMVLINSTWVRAAGMALIIITTILIIWFFRSPVVDRSLYSQLDPLDIVSPSYGTVAAIDKVPMDQVEQDYGPLVASSSFNGENFAWRVTSFLSVLDVHVQCAPLDATLIDNIYHEGSFQPAAFLEKSQYNERNVTKFDARGNTVYVVLLAGLLARKIQIFHEYELGNVPIKRGDKYAIIKFGSRVDTIIPASYTIRVKVGDSLTGGKTVLATV